MSSSQPPESSQPADNGPEPAQAAPGVEPTGEPVDPAFATSIPDPDQEDRDLRHD
jgi:hypothetical protein